MSFLVRQIAPLGTPPAVKPSELPRPEAIPPGSVTALVVLGSDGTDAAGLLVPYQVLVTHEVEVRTVGVSSGLSPVTGNIFTPADYVIGDPGRAPPEKCDIVVVPAILPQDSTLKEWIQAQWAQGSWILSICEGTHLVAATDILNNGRATTHFYGMDELSERSVSVTFLHGHRYVVSGKVVSSAGVSAGLEATLFLIEKMTSSRDQAMDVAARLSYEWTPETDPDGNEARDASFTVDSVRLGGAATPTLRVGVAVFEGVEEISLAAVLVSLPRTAQVELLTFTINRESKYASNYPEHVSTQYGATVVPVTTFHELALDSLSMVVVPTVEEDEETVEFLTGMVPDSCAVRTLGGGRVGDSFFAALKIAQELTGDDSTNLAAMMVEHPWHP